MAQHEHKYTDEERWKFNDEQNAAVEKLYLHDTEAVNLPMAVTVGLIRQKTLNDILRVFGPDDPTAQRLFKKALRANRIKYGIKPVIPNAQKRGIKRAVKWGKSRATMAAGDPGRLQGRGELQRTGRAPWAPRQGRRPGRATNFNWLNPVHYYREGRRVVFGYGDEVNNDRDIAEREHYRLDLRAYKETFEQVYGRFIFEDGSDEHVAGGNGKSVNDLFEERVNEVAKSTIEPDGSIKFTDTIKERAALQAARRRLAMIQAAQKMGFGIYSSGVFTKTVKLPNGTTVRHGMDVDKILKEALENSDKVAFPPTLEAAQDVLRDAEKKFKKANEAKDYFTIGKKWKGLPDLIHVLAETVTTALPANIQALITAEEIERDRLQTQLDGVGDTDEAFERKKVALDARITDLGTRLGAKLSIFQRFLSPLNNPQNATLQAELDTLREERERLENEDPIERKRADLRAKIEACKKKINDYKVFHVGPDDSIQSAISRERAEIETIKARMAKTEIESDSGIKKPVPVLRGIDLEMSTARLAMLEGKLKEHEDLQARAKKVYEGLKLFVENYEKAEDAGVLKNDPKVGAKWKAQLEAVNPDSSDFTLKKLYTVMSLILEVPANSPEGFKDALADKIKTVTDDDPPFSVIATRAIAPNVTAKERFNKQIDAHRNAVTKAQKKVSIKEHSPSDKLDDMEIAQRIIATIVKYQYPDLDARERANLTEQILLNDITTIENYDNAVDWAKRGSAKALNLMPKLRARDFYGRVCMFGYEVNGAVETPFKNIKVEDFNDPERIVDMLEGGTISLKDGFYLLAAFNEYDRKSVKGKKGKEVKKRSMQAIKLEDTLKKLLAEEMGVKESQMNDPAVVKVINRAFEKNLRTLSPTFEKYSAEFGKNKGKVKSNLRAEYRRRERILKRKYQAGEIDFMQYSMDRKDLLAEMRDKGVIGRKYLGIPNSMAWGDGFVNLVLGATNHKWVRGGAYGYLIQRPGIYLKGVYRVPQDVLYHTLDFFFVPKGKKLQFFKPAHVMDTTKKEVLQIIEDIKTGKRPKKEVERLEKQLAYLQKHGFKKPVKLPKGQEVDSETFKKELVKLGKVIEAKKEEEKKAEEPKPAEEKHEDKH
ncbi:MAG: hypothetical protein WC873_02585 [Candidatus Gracilibacteria bacterium]